MTTQKIIRALLEAKFPGLDINVLMEIVLVTPNPDVATEILCGLYEPIIISPTSTKDRLIAIGAQFVSYDKFKQQVKYSYNRVPTKEVWIAKNSIPPLYTDIDPKMTNWAPTDIASYIKISEEEVKTNYTRVTIKGEPSSELSYDTCELDRWQD